MRTEAAVVIGAIEALIIAIVNYVGFRLEMSPEELLLLNAIVTPAIVLIGAIITRANVFSQQTYERDIDVALYEEPPE